MFAKGGDDLMKIPQHVAIILDGNGRWAKGKGMPRNYGHAQGSKNVERICEESWRMGIKYLTVYAFSTENWNRPKDEVDALMKLLRNYMKTCLKTAAKNDMKVRVIGDLSGLDEDIRSRILELEGYERKWRSELPDCHQLRKQGRDLKGGQKGGGGLQGRKAGTGGY